MGFGSSHQMGSDKSTGNHYLQLERLGPEDICSVISRFHVYFFPQVLRVRLIYADLRNRAEKAITIRPNQSPHSLY